MFHLPIVEVIVSIVTSALAAGGLAALFGLMAVESFGFPPLPSEVILLFAGFLIASHAFDPYSAFAAALAGGVVGSFVAYAVGRYARGWLFPKGPRRRLPLNESHLESMDRWFARHGEGTVGVSRLVPVLRAYISYPAGAARMDPLRFGVYTAVGAAPFTAAFLYAGFVLGSDWSAILPFFNLLDDLALAGVAAFAIYLLLRWTDRLTPGFPPRWTSPADRRAASEPPGS